MLHMHGHSMRCGGHLSSRRSVAAMAGPKGKGKQSKLAGLLQKKQQADQKAELQSAEQSYKEPEVRALLLMMANSYWKHTGKYLCETEFDNLPDALFNAPFVLLAHNKFQEGVTDPQFIYANRAGLELFEASWDELMGLPSRKSAPDVPATQQDRNSLLEKAATSGLIQDYSGWRVSLKGKKFLIKGCTLFNIEDQDGDKMGQAAVFDRYKMENGKEVVVEGYQEAAAAALAAARAAAPPTADDVQAAEDAVAKWAEYVRTLKEVQGLTNKDPQVQDAVKNLQAWKAQQANLQTRLADYMAAAKAAFDDEDEE